ncbi:MAG: YggS family pyridoxal phosphate-dependent enzyme [Propionibacteriaceae bacterium]|nr:YggS family pyridoxal phosphate-dependent enzyme [Propionibacteriaceae bacterium]
MAVTQVDAGIVQRLGAVQARIRAACQAAGRSPDEVTLLPVSKTHPFAAVQAVVDAGGPTVFGENRPQELAAKAAQCADGSPIRFALIGHLQTNKAPLAAQHAAAFHALDSARLAEALDRRLQGMGRGLDVLIEVNTSGEEAKHGLAPEEVPAFAAGLAPMDALRVRGLMTVAVHSPDEAAVAACFDRLVALQHRLRDDGVLGADWAQLSMGMSGDFELAIAHGATIVRVGTAIFGARQQ